MCYSLTQIKEKMSISVPLSIFKIYYSYIFNLYRFAWARALPCLAPCASSFGGKCASMHLAPFKSIL